MPNLTIKQIKYFMKDEKKAALEYHRLGLHDLASDEERHYAFFKEMLEHNWRR